MDKENAIVLGDQISDSFITNLPEEKQIKIAFL